MTLGETRVHCSPPSVANIRAAAHALELNRTCGDALRLRLAGLVGRFRTALPSADSPRRVASSPCSASRSRRGTMHPCCTGTCSGSASGLSSCTTPPAAARDFAS